MMLFFLKMVGRNVCWIFKMVEVIVERVSEWFYCYECNWEVFLNLLVSVSLYGFVKSGFFVGISVVIMYLFDMEL